MAAKKKVSKSVERRVAVSKAAPKPRIVEKAPLGEVLVTLDRVIAFLDHATVALNSQATAMTALQRLIESANKTQITGKPTEPVAPVVSKPAAVVAPVAPKVEATADHTASWGTVKNKLVQLTTHEAIDILMGQIERSTILRADEKEELKGDCLARKELTPF